MYLYAQLYSFRPPSPTQIPTQNVFKPEDIEVTGTF
jgi:hypothetical protein